MAVQGRGGGRRGGVANHQSVVWGVAATHIHGWSGWRGLHRPTAGQGSEQPASASETSIRHSKFAGATAALTENWSAEAAFREGAAGCSQAGTTWLRDPAHGPFAKEGGLHQGIRGNRGRGVRIRGSEATGGGEFASGDPRQPSQNAHTRTSGELVSIS
eukprot:351879-Chlamydomonas_euryale.AAC.28